MRIAVATDWFAPRLGGIETQLLSLAEGLGARGHQVDVLTSTPGARDGSAFRVRSLRSARIPWLELAVSPGLVTEIRGELRRGYDVVHAHVSVVSPVGYVAAAVGRLLGLPTVVTFHSVLRHKRHVLRGLDAIAGIGDSAVQWTAVSALVAGQVRQALSNAEVAVLPNGHDLGFWSAARNVARQEPTERMTLVSALRLHRKKRPRALVRAFLLAADRVRRPARLVIVGDGPERSAIARGARDHDSPDAQVELRGWLPPAELRSLYGSATAFVIASTRESFGIAALEATTAGLPVVAMRQAGSSEFLVDGENALLCDDDESFVQAIARVLRDDHLRRRLAASATPQHRYDWNAVLEQHEAAYGRAITRSRHASAAVAASA